MVFLKFFSAVFEPVSLKLTQQSLIFDQGPNQVRWREWWRDDSCLPAGLGNILWGSLSRSQFLTLMCFDFALQACCVCLNACICDCAVSCMLLVLHSCKQACKHIDKFECIQKKPKGPRGYVFKAVCTVWPSYTAITDRINETLRKEEILHVSNSEWKSTQGLSVTSWIQTSSKPRSPHILLKASESSPHSHSRPVGFLSGEAVLKMQLIWFIAHLKGTGQWN